MSMSITAEGRRRGRPPKEPQPAKTFAQDLGEYLIPRFHASYGISFPSAYYADDPVAFSRDVLGEDPWDEQVRILEAVREHPRVAIKSGHKIGKSRIAATIALWFYCSFEWARAVLTSTTDRQVNEILWREVKMLRYGAGTCLDCKRLLKRDPALRIPKPCPHSALIDGELGELARTGLKSEDFREIFGFTAKTAEAIAGISGANVLYEVDEASGVVREIYEAIEGNRAGNAKLVLFGNPTKKDGEFYDAFNSKSRFYHCITVSSESTPNVQRGEIVVPGLATAEWVNEKREEWGEKSPLYLVRVLGEFAEHEEGKIFSLHEIAQAEQRLSLTPAEGRLYIGLDPAGEKGKGDDIVYCARRGLKHLGFEITRGLDDEGHLNMLLQVITKYKHPRETPVVVLDREGSIGAKVYTKLRLFAEAKPGVFHVVGIRASDRSVRQPELYDRMREALAASLAAWLEAGGALIEDVKLVKELHLWEWKQRVDGRVKLWPDKETARKVLGRSPDRYDALALSAWEPLSLREETGDDSSGAALAQALDQVTDPYEANRIWEQR